MSTLADENEIAVDFFSGSGTAAEAVLRLNRDDNGNRRFVLVQIPEPTENHEFPTIAEMAKERIRRVIARMRAGGDDGQLELDLQPGEDLGFKVFKLAPSTFREWKPPEGEEAQALEEQLTLFDRRLEQGADPTDVIYEVILKLGYSLNVQIEPLAMESNRVYRVTDEAVPGPSSGGGTVPGTSEPSHFFICLDDHLHHATIDALPLDKETAFVCLDTALDDSQKVNLAMQCLLKVI